MLIGELANRTGLTRHTIRFYEKNKLIEAVVRRDNNYKEYPDDAERILFAVGRLKKHGYTLREIREFIGLFTDKKHSCADTEPLLESKLSELEERIAELNGIKRNMKAALRKCREHPDGLSCRILADFFGDKKTGRVGGRTQ